MPAQGIMRSPAAPPRDWDQSGNTCSDRSDVVPGDDGRSDAGTRIAISCEDEAGQDMLHEVVMAVNVAERGTVGCAYYVARDEKLCLMEEITTDRFEVVDALKQFVEPTILLVSSKCDDSTFKHLSHSPNDNFASVDARDEDMSNLPCLLECRPMSEFRYDFACDKLIGLRIGQSRGPGVTFVVPGDLVADKVAFDDEASNMSGRQEQLLRLAGWINLENRLSVGCAGAVLSYIQRRRSAAYLPGDENASALFTVRTIEMFTLSGSMFVNMDALLSLQIISTECHPNAQNQGPSTRGWSSVADKEGLSVFGLFHRFTKTTQGRHLIRQYFMRPSCNLRIINERLDTIAVLLQPENLTTMDNLMSQLSRVKNMRITTANLHKGISRGVNGSCGAPTSIWPGIYAFAFCSLCISDHVEELIGAEKLAIRTKILKKFDKKLLAAIGKMVGDVVDFDASNGQRRTIVRCGVDEELDDAKRLYDGIESLLSAVVAYTTQTVPVALDAKCNVIFYPQIGFLISIRLNEDTGQGVYEGPPGRTWELMFATESAAYYKNPQMRNMDSHFGDIYGRICDMEIEIVQKLGEKVLQHAALLNEVSDICGELDSLIALARGAKSYNLVRPQMTTQNVLEIRKGRHLLQELTVATYVANDTSLVGGLGIGDLADFLDSPDAAVLRKSDHKRSGSPSVILMTGPNYSGKSVYLKQVAIIVFMAHIGSFVPAEAAKIGITDKILTRVSARESVSRIQSAFMIDLQQICLAVNSATRRSLIIIDEFGKGTEPSDGAGLAAGVVEHLLQRETDCPKVLCATHFHEIFESGFLSQRLSLGFAHMEVRVDAKAAEADNQIAYLYNYVPGCSISSLGTSCAALSGIDYAVIERAEELTLLSARGQDLVDICCTLPVAEMQELEDAKEIARNFLDADLSKESRLPRQIIESITTIARWTSSIE